MSRKKYPANENILGGRLRSFRYAINFNTVQFSKLLGISQGSLSDIENNKTKPSSTPIDNLVHKTDINIYWLFTGKGSMYRHEKETPLNSIDNIADIPREQIKQWVDDFWKDSDEDERTWLRVEMKRKFPEFAEWLKKNGESLSG